MKALYFDCFSGASGDMIVGALLDAGADFTQLRQGLESLDISGYSISALKVNKGGIMATQFSVTTESHVHQPHRHLHHVLEIIERGALPAEVKAAASETFRRIAECEAAIHGTGVEKVHFHEVGAIDSIVDVVGAHLALHLLGVQNVTASSLHVGSGTVKCDHGVFPVPAPATAMLLRGVPSYGGEVQGELVTPTGAALITQLAQAYGPMAPMTIEAIGYGSGTRDLGDRPNVLRVMIGEVAERPVPVNSIVVIEANVDDMQPELFPPLLVAALEAGARDAFLTPILGKKGRPGYLVTVLCDEAKVKEVVRVLFCHSTTFGVRMRTDQRICLERSWKTAMTPWGAVRIKIGQLDGKPTIHSPEFEDCRARAQEASVAVRVVYEAALAAAVKGELNDA